MTFLKIKSDENLRAAEILISKNLLASSIHCQYYSCFQLMLDILHTSFNFDENSLRDRIENTIGKGLHVKYFNLFKSELSTRKDPKFVNNLIADLKELKRNRTDADYSLVVIEELRCKNSQQLCLKIVKTLNEI